MQEILDRSHVLMQCYLINKQTKEKSGSGFGLRGHINVRKPDFDELIKRLKDCINKLIELGHPFQGSAGSIGDWCEKTPDMVLPPDNKSWPSGEDLYLLEYWYIRTLSIIAHTMVARMHQFYAYADKIEEHYNNQEKAKAAIDNAIKKFEDFVEGCEQRKLDEKSLKDFFSHYRSWHTGVFNPNTERYYPVINNDCKLPEVFKQLGSGKYDDYIIRATYIDYMTEEQRNY